MTRRRYFGIVCGLVKGVTQWTGWTQTAYNEHVKKPPRRLKTRPVQIADDSSHRGSRSGTPHTQKMDTYPRRSFDVGYFVVILDISVAQRDESSCFTVLLHVFRHFALLWVTWLGQPAVREGNYRLLRLAGRLKVSTGLWIRRSSLVFRYKTMRLTTRK